MQASNQDTSSQADFIVPDAQFTALIQKLAEDTSPQDESILPDGLHPMAKAVTWIVLLPLGALAIVVSIQVAYQLDPTLDRVLSPRAMKGIGNFILLLLNSPHGWLWGIFTVLAALATLFIAFIIAYAIAISCGLIIHGILYWIARLLGCDWRWQIASTDKESCQTVNVNSADTRPSIGPTSQ